MSNLHFYSFFLFSSAWFITFAWRLYLLRWQFIQPKSQLILRIRFNLDLSKVELCYENECWLLSDAGFVPRISGWSSKFYLKALKPQSLAITVFLLFSTLVKLSFQATLTDFNQLYRICLVYRIGQLCIAVQSNPFNFIFHHSFLKHSSCSLKTPTN